MIKVIILDFDGVIVESLNIKTEAFRELFKGYPQHLDRIMSYHLEQISVSRYIKFEYIYTHILGESYDDDKAKEAGGKFSALVRKKIIECPGVAGAHEFLEYFSTLFPLYITSATPQQELENIIKERGLLKYFKEVYGTPPWEKYYAMQKIMSQEKVTPREIIYIGDSTEDFKVAQKAGVLFVGRKNKESLDNLGVPVYKDMHGVEEHVRMIVLERGKEVGLS